MAEINQITGSIIEISDKDARNRPVNAYLTDCGDCWVLIDTGTPDFSETVIETVLKYGPAKNIRYIINTHSHVDHTGSNAEIAEYYGSFIVAHKYAEDSLRDSKTCAQSVISGLELWYQPDSAYMDKLISSAGMPSSPDIMFGKDLTLNTGKITFQLFESPGHSADCVSVYIEKDNILFAGDALGETGSDSLPAYDNLNAYYQTLALSAKLKPSLLLSGHVPPVKGKAVGKYFKLCKDRIAATGKAIENFFQKERDPASLKEITREVCEKLQNKFSVRIMSTVLTHLIQLEQKKRIAADNKLWRMIT